MTTKPDNSGLLVIDKPQGVTSHDVVAAVRGALHMKRVGHAGTLDPMATGVLVVGFGNATRLLNYIVDHDKTYLATIRLGQRTTTDDADGELLPEEGTIAEFPSRQTVEDVIAHHFTGRIEQVPNSYSAIKINGQRAYDLAREGKDVDLKARPVTSRNSVFRQCDTAMLRPHARDHLLPMPSKSPRRNPGMPKPTGKTNRTCSQSWNSTWP